MCQIGSTGVQASLRWCYLTECEDTEDTLVIRGVSCCIYYSSSWPYPLIIWSTSNSTRQHNIAGESDAVSNHHRRRRGKGDDHRLYREMSHTTLCMV